jgi:hypothetical protein
MIEENYEKILTLPGFQSFKNKLSLKIDTGSRQVRQTLNHKNDLTVALILYLFSHASPQTGFNFGLLIFVDEFENI